MTEFKLVFKHKEITRVKRVKANNLKQARILVARQFGFTQAITAYRRIGNRWFELES